MLKHEKIIVDVDGFDVAEINPEEAADFYDKVRADNKKASDRKFLILLTRELFVGRVSGWPLEEECTDENKREFFLSFPQKAKEIISDAEEKIKDKREELLGNLLGGASGT